MRGWSRQPLLDACRQLAALGVSGERVGLFQEQAEVASISCPIEIGASTMVVDPRGRGTINLNLRRCVKNLVEVIGITTD